MGDPITTGIFAGINALGSLVGLAGGGQSAPQQAPNNLPKPMGTISFDKPIAPITAPVLPNMGISGSAPGMTAAQGLAPFAAVTQYLNQPVATATPAIDAAQLGANIGGEVGGNVGSSFNALPWLQGAGTLAGIAGTIANLTKEEPQQQMRSVPLSQPSAQFPGGGTDLIAMLQRLASMGK